MSKGSPPVKKFRLRRVEVAVWAKEGADGYVNYQISTQKSFRDKDTGDYVNTSSLYPEEAALAIVLMQRAIAWIAEQRAPSVPSDVRVFSADDQELTKDPFERTS